MILIYNDLLYGIPDEKINKTMRALDDTTPKNTA